MIPIEEIEYEYIHKYFSKLIPKAEDLIPLNPSKLVSHVSDSILSQDLARSTEIVTKSVHNLQVAYNYVCDGHNFTYAVRRLGEVAYDTGKINLVAESTPILGPVISGQMANSCAEKYTNKIVADYKLVDSLKQECIRLKWTKRFGKDFIQSKTGHRPTPGGWKPSEGFHKKVGSIIVNPPNATNTPSSNFTRRIYSKKFYGPRGGGTSGFAPGSSIADVRTVATMNFIRKLKLIIIFSLLISLILIVLYRKYKANRRKNYNGLF
jgi:hypothetical protein